MVSGPEVFTTEGAEDHRVNLGLAQNDLFFVFGFMPRFGRLRIFVLCVLSVASGCTQCAPSAFAQDAPLRSSNDVVSNDIAGDDPNDAPLGDVARALRKKSAATQQVIDDDNLSKVMDEVKSERASGSALRFLMAGETKGFQVSAPDATCSLAFNAGAKSLLSSEYSQMQLPPGEVLKLAGPAVIEGDALTVSVFNGTDWHVSEVTVALTVVKNDVLDETAASDGSKVTTAGKLFQRGEEVRVEKKPDQTILYRMRAASPPSSTTAFSAPLNLDLGSGEEWHWAIVQARGYPPENWAGKSPQTAQVAPPNSTLRTPR